MSKSTIEFNTLSPTGIYQHLWQAYYTPPISSPAVSKTWLAVITQQQNTWQSLDQQDDFALTSWLINVFNTLFAWQNTVLVRGGEEPEYLAAKPNTPAQIIFAHGYFASALHEIAHWCMAGQKRRQLDDFGYWYCPDGRNEQAQALFEQVEIHPQAIECLFSLAMGRYFFVSQDNLDADFDTTNSTFTQDVYAQTLNYLHQISLLSHDGKLLLSALLHLCMPNSRQSFQQKTPTSANINRT